MSVLGVSALLLTACGGLGFGGDAGGSGDDSVATAAGSKDGAGQGGGSGGNGSGGGGSGGNGGGDGGVARPNPTLENGERLFGDDGSASDDDLREAPSPDSPSSGGSACVGSSCGTAQSSVFDFYDGENVEVMSGTVDCDRAMGVMQEYVNTPTDSNSGNMNHRDYGDWSCMNLSAKESTETGFQMSCWQHDGSGSVGIRNPVW